MTAKLERLPAHLMEQPHLFSMDDLSRVKKGQLVAQTRALLLTAIDHVRSCEVGPRRYEETRVACTSFFNLHDA